MDWYVLLISRRMESVMLICRIVVIVLIAAEILVAAVNIVVDLYAGVD